MQSLIVVLSLIPILMGNTDEDIAKIDYYMGYHHQNSDYIRRAEKLCSQILDANPGNCQALWRLSSVYFTKGYIESARDVKLAYYDKAEYYAEKAIDADPQSPDAYFCYGSVLSGILEVKGITQAISLAGPIKEAFEKALDADPNHPESLGALARWHIEAPGIVGGDIDKAISLLKKALDIAPDYTVLHVSLARAYIKQKKYSSARKVLNKCLTVDNPRYPAGFYLNDKPQAQDLLAEIEGK